VAAVELYEVPSCVLSAVDIGSTKEMLSTVLDHESKHDDIIVFLGRFKTALADRTFVLKGITTDGSAPIPNRSARFWRSAPSNFVPSMSSRN